MHARPLSLLAVALATALCALGAATAQADSIAYVKDGNVWLATPDGARQVQVTTTGGYSDVSQADDGTMIGLHGVRLHRLDREGKVLADFDTPVSDTRPAGSRVFHGPFDPALSPDGTKVAYTYYYMTQSQSPTCFPPRCVTAINEAGTGYSAADRQTGWDAPGLGKHSGWRHPAWVDNDTTMLANPSHLPNKDVVLDTLSDGSTGNLVKNWFSDLLEGNKHVGGGDITRDRTKLAFQTGENDTTMSIYWVRQFPTAWKDSDAGEAANPVLCYRYSNPDGGRYSQPTFAPDGGRVAWAEGNGIHVASVPSFTGACTTEGATPTAPLVIPGASEPDWGPADVPAEKQAAPADAAPVGPAAAAGKAKVAVKRAKLGGALRRGLQLTIAVPGDGVLAASARRGGKTVAKATAINVKAGSRAMTLAFTKSARRALRRTRRAALAVTVTFTPKGGAPQTTRLTAKLAR